MVQSRNPSERNKVGEKKKKSQSWLDSVVDAVGDFASGVGKAGRVAGGAIQSAFVDPVRWAIENPDEVAKTFVNPQRASDWLTDNWLAGKEVENLLRGQGGVDDAAIAALGILPVNNIAGNAVKRVFGGSLDDIVTAAMAMPPAKRANRDTIRSIFTSEMREGTTPEVAQFIDAMIEAVETGNKNPYRDLLGGLSREGKGAANLASAVDGSMVDPLTGVIKRSNEDVASQVVGDVVVDPSTGRLMADIKRPEPVRGRSGEADPFLSEVVDDMAALGKGGRQREKIAKGLEKTRETNSKRMENANIPNELLKFAKERSKTAADKYAVKRMGQALADLQAALADEALYWQGRKNRKWK